MKAFLRFSLVLFAALSLACEKSDNSVILDSVFSIKGQIFPRNDASNGLAGVLSTIQFRSKNKVSYTVFAENSLHGSPESILSSGKYLVSLMNEINTLGLVLDSRDFSFGFERLRELSSIAKFPFIASNLEVTNSVPNFIKPYATSPDGRIGVIGLVGPYFASKTYKEYAKAVHVLDPILQCTKYVEDLRKKGVEYIYLYASGYKVSDKSVLPTIEALAKIKGITRIFVGSSTKLQDEAKILPPHVSISFDDDLEYGAGFLELNALDTRSGIDLVSPNKEPEEGILALLTTIRSNVDAEFYATIGPLLSDLKHADTDNSPLGNFVCDGIRRQLGLDCVFINSGAFRVGLKAGDLKLKDLFTILPFDGKIKVIEMTGAQIYEALNYSASFLVDSEKGRGFLQNSGLKYKVRIESKRARIDRGSILIGGKSLVFDQVYKVGIDTYLANGGDGYSQFSSQAQLDPEVYSEISTLSKFLMNNNDWKIDAAERANIIREQKS